MKPTCSRRRWLTTVSGGVAGYSLTRPLLTAMPSTPSAPVAIAKCPDYGAELLPTMDRLFDQLGGLGRIVKGKTVAIKVNLTGSATQRLGYTPAESAQWTHPRVIGAAVHLMGRAGAARIRILESPWSTAEPLEEFMLAGGWRPQDLASAAPRVEFENTNFLGNAKSYSRFPVPGGGHMFRSFLLNHSYADCDVFVSIAKLKEHATCGVTLSMKNCFGITPCTIYGDGAGVSEPALVPKGGRGNVMHAGTRAPSKVADGENDPSTPREGEYRVPRIVADLVAARPIHLQIIDGIETMTAGEGPWIEHAKAVRPGLLVAGTNPVCTDAVGMALMGFDPMADRGKAPFENRDSTLRLAQDHGVGTRDLNRIEVIGPRIPDVAFRFREHRA
jgi:uncharacterized protein (DUF362 family)